MESMCWRRIGRVGVSILTRGMDIALMIVLAYLPPQGGPVVLTILLGSHLLRKAVANCTRPLLRRCVFSCSHVQCARPPSPKDRVLSVAQVLKGYNSRAVKHWQVMGFKILQLVPNPLPECKIAAMHS